MRQTSIETYRQITEDGTINKKQKQVLLLFAKYGQMTGRQLDKKMGSNDGHKRISELARRGLLVNIGKIIDEDTGRPAIVWQYCPQGNLFKVTKAKEQTKAELKQRILELEAEIKKLRGNK